MFEKEAEEYGLSQALWCESDADDLKDAFIAGAELGYSKAGKLQWHKIADRDFPKEKKLYLATTKEGRLILTYYNGMYWETRYNMGAMGHAVEVVFAWCELPKMSLEDIDLIKDTN